MSASRLPNFLVIGAQKAATTTLWAWLRAQPDVFCPPIKEPAYFATEESFTGRGHWYAGLFDPAAGRPLRGEASPQYTMFPRYHGVPERITGTLPDVRLVYVVRDPVERMRSAYRQAVASGRERRSIDDALLTDARFLYPSLYALQLEQYLRVLPRERILVVANDALRPDPSPVVRDVLTFLGANPDAVVAPPIGDLNVGADKRAPRRWWGRLGGVLIRRNLTHRTPKVLVRLNDSGHPLVSRPIDDAELALSSDARAQLVEVLRPDISRFRDLAAEDLSKYGAPPWCAD